MSTKKEKLSLTDIEDLAKYSMQYPAFREDLPKAMTIKTYCHELALEMEYQRELDLKQGLASRQKENREGI